MNPAQRFRRMIAAFFVTRPLVLQRIRWPNPFVPPYRQREINLYRPGELGDVVMCMAVVRAIREKNPGARINFVTRYHELLAGHPLIDGVLSEEKAKALRLRNVIALRYEVFVPPRLHFIDYLAACVGLENIEPKIILPDFSLERTQVAEKIPLPRPWVVVSRKAGAFTPNKDWPNERWNELIARLTASASVIEVGAAVGLQATTSSRRYIDLRGETNMRQYCAAISLADLVISPATSAIHVAAAYHVPSITIMSGFEHPQNSAYRSHEALYHPVPCSPCWLRTPCPFDLKCLRAIEVNTVLDRATAVLRRSAMNQLRPAAPPSQTLPARGAHP
jgi:ADP-heptose:LPS heptosyltransferase